jgi:hypothetical protein
MKTQKHQYETHKQEETSKVFNLSEILFLISLAWIFLLYPVGVHHANTMLHLGFLPIKFENHLCVISILMGISILGRKWLGKIKLEMLYSIAYACGGGMLWIIVFFISVSELAIPLFLVSTLAIAFVVKQCHVKASYLQIGTVTACVYTSQAAVYLTIFSLFFGEAEGLAMSALLFSTHVACIFTAILTLGQSVDLLKRKKLNISEIILTDMLALCLTTSIVLLGIYSKSSTLPFGEVVTIIFTWLFLRGCNYYLQQKSRKTIRDQGGMV